MIADKRRITPGLLADLIARSARQKARDLRRNCGGQGRYRTADLPLFRRTLIPTELPGRKAASASPHVATLTGLEPATSAVTGRRANQLRHRALLLLRVTASQVPPTGFEPALPP